MIDIKIGDEKNKSKKNTTSENIPNQEIDYLNKNQRYMLDYMENSTKKVLKNIKHIKVLLTILTILIFIDILPDVVKFIIFLSV